MSLGCSSVSCRRASYVRPHSEQCTDVRTGVRWEYLILYPAADARTFVPERDIRGRHHDLHRLCGPDCEFMERSSHKWPARKRQEVSSNEHSRV